MSSRSDPIRPVVILRLAVRQFKRYKLSNQIEDLDKSIFYSTESILLLPRSWPEHGPLIFNAFFLLAFALLKRSKGSNQPEDAAYSAKYLRHLRDQNLEMIGISRYQVTLLLVDALAVQVKLEAANMMQNIGEMAALFRELLSSGASEDESIDLVDRVTSACEVVVSKLSTIPGLDQPLDQLVECLRLARTYKPELRYANLNLVYCLCNRYLTTFVNGDYEEAVSILDDIITSSYPGESLGKENVAMVQRIVVIMALHRSDMHGIPEYSEEAIYRARTFLSLSSVDDPIRLAIAYKLDETAKDRFDYFGSVEGLEASSSNLPSFDSPDLRASLGLHDDTDMDLDRIVHKKMELLSELRLCIRNSDITKIDEVIEKGRTILAPSSPRESHAPILFELFCDILSEAFDRTEKIEYLTESISTRRQVLEHSSDPVRRFYTRGLISLSLVTRSMSVPDRHTQDLDEIIKLLSLCANDVHASLPNRYLFACTWSFHARLTYHPSVSTAYEAATLLAPRHTAFRTNLTATACHSRQLEEAIETLERGRALLWSEMHHLRTSIDQLMQADPQLGLKFSVVNRDLEELAKSIAPSLNLSMDDGAADDLRAADPFGRLLLKQRSLLKERDKLISQIRVLPGLEGFLTSPSFDKLRSAASGGPVIIINHSRWRSDILILLHGTTPSLIPTPRDFYCCASALKDKLLDSRHRYGLDSRHYDRALASVLAELYDLVGKPILDRLCQLKVPKQSRVWLCPTSVFCSLPLHAMGPIPDEGGKRYFMDLYICSYTPTLSALIQSRTRHLGLRSSERPNILLVAQPDPSLPTVDGEIQVVQDLRSDSNIEVNSLISEAATPAAVIDGFRQHQFVHFACHGTLEDGKPFETGFELSGGERLTLLEIVRSHLPTAEFAFLSACHTAEVTEGSAADEGLHLVAAVQYCGFKSVVGTSWAMVDEDGRDLARHFYKALFSTEREQGAPYYERSAKALRVAVKKLRRKKQITLERWANFVHYGA